MDIYTERRGLTRAEYVRSCSIHFSGGSCDCYILNFSLTGILVITDAKLKPGRGEKVIIKLEQFSPEISMARIDCEVVRLDGKKIGIQFNAIDYKTLMKLKEILFRVVKKRGSSKEEVPRNLFAN